MTDNEITMVTVAPTIEEGVRELIGGDEIKHEIRHLRHVLGNNITYIFEMESGKLVRASMKVYFDEDASMLVDYTVRYEQA